MRIYIAGPMTGLPDLNRPAFRKAENRLYEMGFDTLNPAALTDMGSWQANIERSINVMLSECDRLVLLPGSSRSSGAMIEFHIANALGWPICALTNRRLLARWRKDNSNVLTFLIPVRTWSEANQRLHWAKAKKRHDNQQLITACYTRQWINDPPPKPWRITLTRIGPRRLDPDNAAGSTKYVQDALCGELGIDDGDPAHEWCYDQRQGKQYGVEVSIETNAEST